jgi:glycosyltransferase involved in cell wall biosynthesis
VKIAFVITWYGKNIGGGAEAECRGLATAIHRLRKDVQVEILTTCLKEFAANWDVNHYTPGIYFEDGIKVRRFNALYKDRTDFHPLNYFRLMPSVLHDLYDQDGKIRSPLTEAEEREYIQNMVISPELFQYIAEHQSEYDFFVFIPYMFASTALGSEIAPHKSVIIPCLHQERYAFMRIYREMMKRSAGVMFHVPAEQRFANQIYDISPERQFLIGEKVEIDVEPGKPERFRQKYGIDSPFLLYAGRKIEGKNLPELVSYFTNLKSANLLPSEVKLVIIGGGDLSYQGLSESLGVRDLGFVSASDKLDAMAAASCLVQPSLNESFSIVMMEAWLQSTPVVVDGRCDVTREHCEISGGGLSYVGQDQFNKALTSMLDEKFSSELGRRGRRYVVDNFSEEKVVDRFCVALTRLKPIDSRK